MKVASIALALIIVSIWFESAIDSARADSSIAAKATAPLQGVDQANAMVHDDAWFYVATAEGDVLRFPRSGGAPEKIAHVPFPIRALAVDHGEIFFMTGEGLYRVPAAGGRVVVLDQREAVGDLGESLTADDEAVYYTVWRDERRDLIRRPRRGGKPERLCSACNAESLLVDGDWLYWSRWQPGRIERIPKRGGPSTLVTGGLDRPDNLRAGARDLFFADGRPAVVGAVPKTGGAFRRLAEDRWWCPVALDVDGDTLFVFDYSWKKFYDEPTERYRLIRIAADGSGWRQLGPVLLDCDSASSFDARGGLALCGSPQRPKFWSAMQ